MNIGNKASTQFQLDVYGEVAAALSKLPEAPDDIKVSATDLQARLMDQLCKIWEEPDDGIWETRGGRKHFVHSKVMAWVALDRAIKHYEQYDGGGDVERWKKNRAMIHKQVLRERLRQEAELVCPVLRVEAVGRFVPAHRLGGLPADG